MTNALEFLVFIIGCFVSFKVGHACGETDEFLHWMKRERRRLSRSSKRAAP